MEIIDVYSSKSGLGATTFSAQLVKFLKRMNYTAAMVDWGTEKTPENNIIEDVEIYGKNSDILEKDVGGYDYIIVDKGNNLTKSAYKASTILLYGIKANELPYFNNIKNTPLFENAIRVCCHSPEKISDICMPYAPDIFGNNDNKSLDETFYEVMNRVVAES